MITRVLYYGLVLIALCMSMPVDSYAQKVTYCGFTPSPCDVAPTQGGTLFNSSTTSAAATAITVTIAAVTGARTHIYSVDAWCSAGTSSITVTDGGTTIWQTLATEITTTHTRYVWSTGLTGATNSAVVITLASCGGANTGTLTVQADRF